MNKLQYNKITLSAIIVLLASMLVLPVTITACKAQGDPMLQDVLVGSTDDLVDGTVTAQFDQIDPANPPQAVVWPLDALPSEDLKEAAVKLFGPNTTMVVTTVEAYVKPTVYKKIQLYVPPSAEDPEKADYIALLLNTIKGVTGVLPGGPALQVGVAYLASLLLAKRSRQHMATMVKALVPTNGKVEITTAVTSLGKATGYLHTNETPEELRAVADRLEAKAEEEALAETK